MRRRAFIAALGGAAAWPLVARGQQSNRVRRVGVLVGFSDTDDLGQDFVRELRKSLTDLGLNIELDLQWGFAGARAKAEQLMSHAPDAIVANGTAMLIASQQVTKTVPIVFMNVSDPVGGKLVQSMSRPGGNSTGFTNYEDDIGSKWLELLKEGLPNLQRAFAMQDPSSPSWIGQLKSIRSAADGLGLGIVPAEVRELRDIQNSIDAARSQANTGLVVMPSVFTVGHRSAILDLTLQHKIPAIYPFSLFARDGGLTSYGTGGAWGQRQVASYLDRIFRGQRPADMPVQAPTQLELLINRKTANEIGAQISPTLLARADEVIE
jgi:putative tryptophan/tyrosine transport system substrate-binding protein